jgi:hypothetical protein
LGGREFNDLPRREGRENEKRKKEADTKGGVSVVPTYKEIGAIYRLGRQPKGGTIEIG